MRRVLFGPVSFGRVLPGTDFETPHIDMLPAAKPGQK
jgi:hypothetical protein